MNAITFVMGALLCTQLPATSAANPAGGAIPAPSLPAASAPVPIAPASSAVPPTSTAAPVNGPISPEDVQDLSNLGPNFAPPATYAPQAVAMPQEARGLFESDHEFDGFVGPLINPVQTKDPRSLTEARLLTMFNWSRPSTPVIGGGALQVYALQLRLAVNERLQIFADKDGIVRFSPKGGQSITGLANINAGAKYVFIRDVENQFLVTGVVQYEAPTGYANIFQNQGSGLLSVYGVIGKEFWDNWHFIGQFGQTTRLHNANSGYFLTSAHIDRRFGAFVPFYEASWLYYNQSGEWLPGVGIEAGGWVNLGAQKVMGLNYITNAVGFKYDFSKNLEFGVAYEFQLSDRTMLLNNMVNAELILRY